MQSIEIKPIEIKNSESFDGLYHFKTRKNEIKAFKDAAGKKAPEYMRQAMRQITRQLTEPEAQAS
jgi:hypothetical protein